MQKLERLVKCFYWNLDPDSLMEVANEARVTQLARYGNLLDDQAKVHQKVIIREAARNLGLHPKSVSMGDSRVVVLFGSLDAMIDDTGYEPETYEEHERPEVAIAQVYQYLPPGPIKDVFDLLLNEQAATIEKASQQLNLVPQRVFDVLGRIGAMLRKIEELPEGWFSSATEEGMKRAIARACESLSYKRAAVSSSFCQQSLFA